MFSWLGSAKKIPPVNNTRAPVAKPIVKIGTFKALCEKLLKKTDNNNYGFNSRNLIVPPSLSLNIFLFFIAHKSLQDDVQYKVSIKAMLEFIDYCHFNAKPSEMMATRVACGASVGNYQYYYTVIDEHDSPILSAAAEFEHTSRSEERRVGKEC